MKKIVIFCLLALNISFAFSQEKGRYEILQNDPLSNNNLFFYFSPVGFNLSNNINLLFGLGSTYIHDDQFEVDITFRRSYTESINENLKELDAFQRGSRYIQPLTPDKHLTYMELKGQYFLGSRITTGKVKIEVHSTSHVSTYIKVPAERFLAFPVRMGYTYYQTIMSTNKFGGEYASPFIGADASIPNGIPSAVNGVANFGAHLLHFGLGVYVRDHIMIQITDSRPEYQGLKNKKGSSLWYVDVLVPMAQNIENVMLIEKTNSTAGGQVITETEYNLNDYTPKTSYGFRAGVRQIFESSGLLSGSYWMEGGFRPGPIDNKTNYYLNFGIDVLIARRTF